jgi:hypothetical protein
MNLAQIQHKIAHPGKNILAQIKVPHSKQPHQSRPRTNNLPRQLSRRILAISAKAQSRAQSHHRDSISNEHGVIAVLLELSGLLLSLGFRGFGFLFGCLLGFFRNVLSFSFGACFLGLRFTLETLKLGLGLDGLAAEV